MLLLLGLVLFTMTVSGATEIPICTNPAIQEHPAISGDTIVWIDWRNGGNYIYKWDPVNGEQPVANATTNIFSPKISGDTVVWMTGFEDIYKWDPVNGKQPITTYTASQYNPAISGDTIIWADSRNGNWDIYKWDPVNGEQPVTTNTADQVNPAISGDTIVWEDSRNGMNNQDIYAATMSTKIGIYKDGV